MIEYIIPEAVFAWSGRDGTVRASRNTLSERRGTDVMNDGGYKLLLVASQQIFEQVGGASSNK